MAIDDPPDDMSDHPDHPENHNFVLDVSTKKNIHERLGFESCMQCGMLFKDHPYSIDLSPRS